MRSEGARVRQPSMINIVAACNQIGHIYVCITSGHSNYAGRNALIYPPPPLLYFSVIALCTSSFQTANSFCYFKKQIIIFGVLMQLCNSLNFIYLISQFRCEKNIIFNKM